MRIGLVAGISQTKDSTEGKRRQTTDGSIHFGGWIALCFCLMLVG
jgi:hypothetical protein